MERDISLFLQLFREIVKNPPAMQETPVQFLGHEDPLEKGQATHSSILGLPLWLSWYRMRLQCGRPGIDLWVGKILWRRDRLSIPVFLGFPCGSAGKESACNVGDLGSISGLGRPPEEGKGYPLQHAGLENSMDCIIHRVAKSRTQLSDFHFQGNKQKLKERREAERDIFLQLVGYLSCHWVFPSYDPSTSSG